MRMMAVIQMGMEVVMEITMMITMMIAVLTMTTNNCDLALCIPLHATDNQWVWIPNLRIATFGEALRHGECCWL